MNNKPKIIIDTDPGIDDTLAIWYLLGSQLLNVLGLTTVAGNVIIEKTTRNALHILTLVKTDIPVWSGASRSLAGTLRVGSVMGKEGLGNEVSSATIKLNGLAVQKIIDNVRAYPHQVTLLCIGPLTNIAMAFNLAPDLPSLIKEIVILGGAQKVANMGKNAEFNFYIDPVAADIVLQSSVSKCLVPLDRCHETTLELAQFDQLRECSFYPPLIRMVVPYSQNLLTEEKQKEIVVYDALAVFCLLNKNFIKTEEYNLSVETSGEEIGKLIFRPEEKINAAKTTYFVSRLDKNMFRKQFFEFLKRLG